MSFITGTNSELIYANTASGTAKASFTSEFVINDTAGMGERANIPPYFWAPSPYGVGKVLRIVARGIVSVTGTPTWTFSIRLGTSGSTTAAIVLGSGAVAAQSGITNQLWELQGDVVMRTVGAAGANSTVQGLGLVSGPGAFTSGATFNLFGGAASPGTVATVDVSIINYINFNVACSANSASNSIQLLQLLVFGLN